MEYVLKNASNKDIQYLIDAKLYNIFKYAHDLDNNEVTRINEYVLKHIPMEVPLYKLIIVNGKVVGCLLVINKDDGVLLDEIYIDDEYRGNGIGTDIITNVVDNNSIVYLCVYKENIRAINLYKRIGFKIVEETDLRYEMKYEK